MNTNYKKYISTIIISILVFITSNSLYADARDAGESRAAAERASVQMMKDASEQWKKNSSTQKEVFEKKVECKKTVDDLFGQKCKGGANEDKSKITKESTAKNNTEFEKNRPKTINSSDPKVNQKNNKSYYDCSSEGKMSLKCIQDRNNIVKK